MKHTTPRATLLYGEWAFYIEYYARKIAKTYSQAQKSQFDFGDYRFQEVLEVLSQDSLFATGNLVCLRLDKKLGAKEIHALLDTLALHPRNALIIEFYQAKDKSSYAQDFKQFATQFKHPKLGDRVIDVRFFMPNLDALLELLQEKVHALGLSIDTPALLLLLEVQNNDVRIIYQDLEKLALLGKPIGVTEVQEHVYGLMGVETQELLEAIFEKPQKVLESFARLQGVEEMELVWGLERYFYQLFLIFAYLKGHHNLNAKEILGFNPPPMVIKQLTKRSQQVQDYQGVFEGLRAWHIASMQGQKDAGWHFLIKVQDYIR
ncbi:DNA polymerase III subunit delta [Helicobacter bizzozeronii]|uniref:DNA polymerase III subunit delta n=1 Tax=Helicobacter bizzozeronii TaxID=56877 RepID=UPI0018F83277|nr:DNA polymerase III [Helicobacter bizzozeronii]